MEKRWGNAVVNEAMTREEIGEVVRAVMSAMQAEKDGRSFSVPAGNVQIGMPEQISQEMFNDGRMSDGMLDLWTSGGGSGSEQMYAFSVYWDAEEETYKVFEPIVTVPSGEIMATYSGITAGTWYCNVTKEEGAWSANITNENTPGGHTVALIKLFNISEGGEITQYHVGVITIIGSLIVTGTDDNTVSGTELVFKSADDSNVKVMCEEKSGEPGIIEAKVGVYWKP